MRIPNDTELWRGALTNRAVQAVRAAPLADCPDLCTDAGIREGRPCIVVCQFGYISTSAFDAEDELTQVPALGKRLSVRALEPDDEWHPMHVRVVFQAAKLPRTDRPGHRRDKRAELADDLAHDDGAVELAAALGLDGSAPAQKSEPEDDDDLARQLGLLGGGE